MRQIFSLHYTCYTQYSDRPLALKVPNANLAGPSCADIAQCLTSATRSIRRLAIGAVLPPMTEFGRFRLLIAILVHQ